MGLASLPFSSGYWVLEIRSTREGKSGIGPVVSSLYREKRGLFLLQSPKRCVTVTRRIPRVTSSISGTVAYSRCEIVQRGALIIG